MLRAVVFDMDGVLIDAREWHYEALNRALALVGHEITREEHLHEYDGLPTRRKLEMHTASTGLPPELHDFLNNLKQQYTMEYVATQCKPVFQHEFALASLRSAGYRLAVASNSVRRTVIEMMDRSALAPYLEFLVSNEDVVRPKPDPEIYCRAMELLAVEAHETLVVEDNINGIRAARDAGAHVMVVSNPDDVTLDAVLAEVAACERGMAVAA